MTDKSDPLNIKYDRPTEYRKLRIFKNPEGVIHIYVPYEASYSTGVTETGKDFAEFELADTLDGAKFKIGDQVIKTSGYKFDGEIRGVFTNKKGQIRVAVEHADGWLHIFNEDQMELA